MRACVCLYIGVCRNVCVVSVWYNSVTAPEVRLMLRRTERRREQRSSHYKHKLSFMMSCRYCRGFLSFFGGGGNIRGEDGWDPWKMEGHASDVPDNLKKSQENSSHHCRNHSPCIYPGSTLHQQLQRQSMNKSACMYWEKTRKLIYTADYNVKVWGMRVWISRLGVVPDKALADWMRMTVGELDKKGVVET